MKKQTVLTGVRKWHADDFLVIQNEIMDAQEAYFAPYGNCVIKGCEVAGQDIAAGICYIGGKIVRFAGTSGVTSFPVYLELNESISKTREYQTGGVKEIEREFKAVLNTSVPAGEYLTINPTGGKTFRDAFQDANNRMVKDSDISNWNAKEPAITKKTGFNKDKSDSVSSSNTDVLATSAAVRIAYNRGSVGVADAASAYNRGSQGITDAANALSVANLKLGANAKAVDSDKVDAYNTSKTSTINTVAIRDSAGKLTAVDFIPTSDKRLKDEINYDLSKVSIDGLKPISFKINGHFRYGFIAQDMRTTHPELVIGTGKEKANGKIDYLSIKETSISALLVKEVQELKETVNQLKEKRINIFKRITWR